MHTNIHKGCNSFQTHKPTYHVNSLLFVWGVSSKRNCLLLQGILSTHHRHSDHHHRQPSLVHYRKTHFPNVLHFYLSGVTVFHSAPANSLIWSLHLLVSLNTYHNFDVICYFVIQVVQTRTAKVSLLYIIINVLNIIDYNTFIMPITLNQFRNQYTRYCNLMSVLPEVSRKLEQCLLWNWWYSQMCLFI